MGQLVPREKLANAAALMETALASPGIIGPALAGVLIGISFVGAGGLTAFPTGVLADELGERAVMAGMGVAIVVVIVGALVIYGRLVAGSTAATRSPAPPRPRRRR